MSPNIPTTYVLSSPPKFKQSPTHTPLHSTKTNASNNNNYEDYNNPVIQLTANARTYWKEVNHNEFSSALVVPR